MVVRDGLWLCPCCTLGAVNGESCECHDDHDKRVTRGLASFGPHLVPDFDSETGEGHHEFSSRPCDCCGSLAGERHRFAVLGK